MRNLEEDHKVADFFLREIEHLRSRDFTTGLLFRIAFFLLMLTAFYSVFGLETAPNNLFEDPKGLRARYGAAFMLGFALSVFLSVFWTVLNFLSGLRLKALQEAFRLSASESSAEAFQFLRIAAKYNFESRLGEIFVFISRIEPILWLVTTLFLGIVSADYLNVLKF